MTDEAMENKALRQCNGCHSTITLEHFNTNRTMNIIRLVIDAVLWDKKYRGENKEKINNVMRTIKKP